MIIEAQYKATDELVVDEDSVVPKTNSVGVLRTEMSNALDKTNDHVTNHPTGLSFVNLSASATVLTGVGRLRGMYVNSTNVGTIKIYDNTAASGTIINNTITPAIGYHDLGNALVGTGIYVAIGGTVLDVTIYYEA